MILLKRLTTVAFSSLFLVFLFSGCTINDKLLTANKKSISESDDKYPVSISEHGTYSLIIEDGDICDIVTKITVINNGNKALQSIKFLLELDGEKVGTTQTFDFAKDNILMPNKRCDIVISDIHEFIPVPFDRKKHKEVTICLISYQFEDEEVVEIPHDMQSKIFPVKLDNNIKNTGNIVSGSRQINVDCHFYFIRGII